MEGRRQCKWQLMQKTDLPNLTKCFFNIPPAIRTNCMLWLYDISAFIEAALPAVIYSTQLRKGTVTERHSPINTVQYVKILTLLRIDEQLLPHVCYIYVLFIAQSVSVKLTLVIHVKKCVHFCKVSSSIVPLVTLSGASCAIFWVYV